MWWRIENTVQRHICVQSLQPCLTLCNPVDCRLTGSSVHGILQARILEWVAMPSSSSGLISSVQFSRSVVSNSLRPHGLQPARLFCPWDSPGKSTGVCCCALSRASSQTRDQTHVSCIAGRFFTLWALGNPQRHIKKIQKKRDLICYGCHNKIP